MPHDASDSPTSSSSLYHHASSSSQQHVTLPLQHKPAALSSFKLTAKQRYAPTAHSSAASAQHMTSSSSQQAAAQHSSSNAAQRMTSSSPQQAQHAGDSNLLQATAQQGGSGAAELLEAADRPSNAPSDQPLHKLGSYRISDLELDEEDGLAASTDTAGADAADVASVDGSDHQDCSKKQAARKFQVKPRTANGGKAAAVQVRFAVLVLTLSN